MPFGDEAVLYVIASLAIAIYTVSFAADTWRTGNRLGAVGLGLLAALAVGTWVLVYITVLR